MSKYKFYNVYNNCNNTFYCNCCKKKILTDHFYIDDKIFCMGCFYTKIISKYFTNNIVNCRDFMIYCYPELEDVYNEMSEEELRKRIPDTSVVNIIDWLNE